MKKHVIILNNGGNMAVSEKIKECIIIYNPISTGFKEDDLNLIVKTLRAKGIHPEFAKSMYQGHLIELVKEADKKNTLVLTLGGDGTVGEAYKALDMIKQKGIYAHVPTGTTNDMAKNYDVRYKDPNKIVEDIVNGEEVSFDTYKVNGTPCAYTSTFGYCSHIPYITPGSLKKKLGHAAYVTTALKPLLKGPENYNITYNTNDVSGNTNCILGCVSNSKGFAGINIFPNAKLDDGMIEMLLISKLSPGMIAKIFKEYLKDNINLSEMGDCVTTQSAPKISLTFNDELYPSFPLDIDGDNSHILPTKDNSTIDFEVGKKVKILKRKKK